MFSGRNGSPALPKIDSTKSKLLTRLPGAKKRISIDWPFLIPGTFGETEGRKSNERNDFVTVFPDVVYMYDLG